MNSMVSHSMAFPDKFDFHGSMINGAVVCFINLISCACRKAMVWQRLCSRRGAQPWYAQLRVLFSFERRDFALVRWYDDSPMNDVLSRHGCRRLKWAMQSGPRQNLVPWYQVSPSVFQEQEHVHVHDWETTHYARLINFTLYCACITENAFHWCRSR